MRYWQAEAPPAITLVGRPYGIEPMPHGQDMMLRLREDVVTESDQHVLFQSVAPQVENGLYLVPKVIE